MGDDLYDATILLVDDTEPNLRALSAVLEPLGHRVLTASSGEEALRHLLATEVDLILLDVRMPGMDGFETARHIKERERTRDVPIVFLTAFGDDATAVAAAISTGAVDYLAKPVDPTLLRAKVEVLVDLHQRTVALRQEREALATELDLQYAVHARTLERLSDAALAINSTQSLAEMLDTINGAARHVIGADMAETVLLSAGSPDSRSVSRSASAKYATWLSSPVAEVAPVYEIVWRAGVPVRMTGDDIRRAFASYGVRDVPDSHPVLAGWLAAPLVGRSGRRLGVIQVADKEDGEFLERDEWVLFQLAQLAAVAIENAEQFELEHAVAAALQRALLPRSLPKVAGVEVAVRYRAGGAGTEVGGDWYDLVALEDGRAVLTLGDVMGRGARAAAVMGQLRTALHAYALQDLPPSAAMRSADLLLQDVADGDIATAIYAVLDPATGRIELVTSGHPSPVVVTPGGVPEFLECGAHTPLGVLSAPVYEATAETLAPGTVLLLYTDGLVEQREASLDDRLDELLVAVGRACDDLESLCDRVLETMVPAAGDDDIALVAVRLGR